MTITPIAASPHHPPGLPADFYHFPMPGAMTITPIAASPNHPPGLPPDFAHFSIPGTRTITPVAASFNQVPGLPRVFFAAMDAENAQLDAVLAEALLDLDEEKDQVTVGSTASTNDVAVNGKEDKSRRLGRRQVIRTEWSPLPAELDNFPFTKDVDGEFVICQALAAT